MKTFLAITALLLLSVQVKAVDELTLVHCGTLLDVEKKQALSDQKILIRNDVIEAMGADVSAPESAPHIDLSVQVCMPGLMDSHVYLLIDSTRGTVDAGGPTQSSAFNALFGLTNAQRLLATGFTTIRVTGDLGYHYSGIEVREAIERGDFIGPRMIVAPHAISRTGGHADFNSYAPDLPTPVTGPMVVDGADNLRLVVRKEIKYGADWIKIAATGGVMSQHDDPNVAAYTKEEFEALADETHRHGKKIMAHAHGDPGIRAAVEAGFDSIEHGALMEEDTAKLMGKRGTFYVPTVYVVDWILEQGRKGGITANNLEKAIALSERHSESVRMAVKHGVPLVVGSDPIFPMEEAIREFAALDKRVDDKWLVLQGGTFTGARMVGMEDQIGSIKVGKQADIVAMPDSPLDDMTNIEHVNFVMKDGVVIKQR